MALCVRRFSRHFRFLIDVAYPCHGGPFDHNQGDKQLGCVFRRLYHIAFLRCYVSATALRA